MKITKTQLKSLLRETRVDDELDRGYQDYQDGEGRDPDGSEWYQDGYNEAAQADEKGKKHPPTMRESSNTKITERQLRRIIKEELARDKINFASGFEFPKIRMSAYSKLEDLAMENIPADVEFLTAEEFAKLEQVVLGALSDLKDRIVGDPRGL